MAYFKRLHPTEPTDPVLALHAAPDEVSVLATIPERLRSLLTECEENSPIIRRLFPIAHENPLDEIEHRELLGNSLFEERRENLERFQRTLDARKKRLRKIVIELNEGETDLWLHVINDLRLVLATKLGISDNGWEDRIPEDPEQFADHALLEALSMVQELMIAALMQG